MLQLSSSFSPVSESPDLVASSPLAETRQRSSPPHASLAVDSVASTSTLQLSARCIIWLNSYTDLLSPRGRPNYLCHFFSFVVARRTIIY